MKIDPRMERKAILILRKASYIRHVAESLYEGHIETIWDLPDKLDVKKRFLWQFEQLGKLGLSDYDIKGIINRHKWPKGGPMFRS